MMEDIINWFWEVSKSGDVILDVVIWYLIIASVIFLIFFIRDEYYLVRRNLKKCIFLNASDATINKNYGLSEFIEYNAISILLGIGGALLGMVFGVWIWLIISLLLLLMTLIEEIFKLIGIWILIPIGIILLKMILYRISLRYKK